MNDHPIFVGFVGTATSSASLFLSLLPHLTAGVQFATACFGLAAAICTAIYMSRKVRKQNDENSN
jgi:hypothetical protein